MEFRNGAVGALMDEYERAVSELLTLFESVTEPEYKKLLDPETSDENCRSVQTIMSHVVSSGYSYSEYLRKAFHMDSSRPPKRMLAHAEVGHEMKMMMDHTVETLRNRWEMPEAEIMAVRIESHWGVNYDVEQILEHAIVHVLRHRRQIQKLTGL